MSSFDAHHGVVKRRSYRLGRRAEKQGETKRRIVEAAVSLHGTLGPARTTVAQIAEHAGVQRHTYYAHFPDDRSLFLACSAHALERDPLPDVERWQALAAGAPRVRGGLDALYSWYQRNESMTACVLRDSAFHELTREIVDMRMAPIFQRAATILGEGFGERGRALLKVALQFECWRTLSETHDPKRAATLLADAVHSVDH
jgi:AcrR family transcriptional regulator